jgi:hypothetical protein
MLIWALMAIFFWAVVPGLITGWMLRERGRSFLKGLFIGAVCGPVGILATLAFIYVADRRHARGRSPVRGHAVRVFYDIPVVGRLHVSTVWALAGLATFLCLWMIGGITYEFYRTNPDTGATDPAEKMAAVTLQPKGLLDANASTGAQVPESRLNATTQNNTSPQTRAALLGSFTAPSGGQPAPGAARPENSATNGQTAPPEGSSPAAAPQPQEAVAAGQPPTSAPSAPSSPAPPAKAPAQSREAAAADVTRDLNARGYRVHAALSGDAQTATLTLSGAALTHAVGNQLLANGRLRGTLKSAGVRIVVVLNGEESWTYIL